MRFLFVSSRFSRDGDSGWLIDDLVSELAGDGHEVDVVVGDLKRPRRAGWQPQRVQNVRVFSVGPESASVGKRRFLGALVRGFKFRSAVRSLSAEKDYDVVLFSTIACLYARSAYIARANGAKVGLFVWDFFPLHHFQIGLIPKWFSLRLLKHIEKWGVGRPDVLFVMSPLNRDFAECYYGLTGSKFQICPPWAAEGAVEAKVPCEYAKGVDDVKSVMTAVFGGQLAAGRGLEQIVDAAELLQSREVPVRVVVAGDGPRSDWLSEQIVERRLGNLLYIGHVDRDAYRELLNKSDVGIAATVPGVSAPTFPSKIGDYAANGLALLISTEAASDVGDLVESYQAGISVASGSGSAMAAGLELLNDEWQSGVIGRRHRQSRLFFEDLLSARSAADAVVASISGI